MSKKFFRKKAEEAKEEVKEVVDTVQQEAAQAAVKAAEAASKLVEQAEAAAEDAMKKADHAVKAAGGVAEDLTEKAVEAARDGLEAVEATKLVEADVADVGKEALADVEKHMKGRKKRGKFGRFCLWSSVLAGVSGAAYVVWRRSQPVEDPWAEEYWVDLKTDDESGVDKLVEALEETEAVVEEALTDD